jgi:osmoprotectant transport system substrate-binding protein
MHLVWQGSVRTTRRGRETAAIVLVLALAASGCGAAGTSNSRTGTAAATTPAARKPGAGKPAVTLGTKNFTEELILGQLYAQALRAKGFSVTLKSDIGPSERVDRELTTGGIDGYPEYTGTILSLFGHAPRRPASAPEAYQLAVAVERRRGAAVLAMAPATDTDVIVTTPTYASQHRLSSLADLAKLGSSATLAGPPEFRTRFAGLVGLRRDYGVSALRFAPTPIGSQYAALANGRAQLIVAFTTDGNLTRGGYTMLTDPKGIFGFQNVTFVVRASVLSREGPAFAQTINAVSARLSTQALRVMNADVSLGQQSPATVAQQFLGANGLL